MSSMPKLPARKAAPSPGNAQVSTQCIYVALKLSDRMDFPSTLAANRSGNSAYCWTARDHACAGLTTCKQSGCLTANAEP
jgi:hypothetical protein